MSTYCNSVSFVKLSNASPVKATRAASTKHVVKSREFSFPKFNIQLNVSLLVAFVIGVNLVLGVFYAVLINQASVSGYKLAKLERQKAELSKTQTGLEVKLAGVRAVKQEGVVLPGFVPVAKVDFVGSKTQVSKAK